jgi:hypothetical protein
MRRLRRFSASSSWLPSSSLLTCVTKSVVNLHHIDADPNADPDSTNHPDADAYPDPDSAYYLMRIRIRFVDPNPDSSFQIKVQTHENVPYSNRLKFHTFWLVWKLMRIRFRSGSLWCGSGCGCGSWFLFDVDGDPGYQNDADPCGFGSTTMVTTIHYKPKVSDL